MDNGEGATLCLRAVGRVDVRRVPSTASGPSGRAGRPLGSLSAVGPWLGSRPKGRGEAEERPNGSMSNISRHPHPWIQFDKEILAPIESFEVCKSTWVYMSLQCLVSL